MSSDRLTYKQVKQNLVKLSDNSKIAVTLIEDPIIAGRDDNKLPVYITRFRLKTPDSCYLKTKRDPKINKSKKENKLMEINDLIGIRILCLFEKYIFDIHEFIVEKLPEITITKIKIFNCNETDFNSIVAISKKHKINCVHVRENRKSGYRSLHYQVEIKGGNNIILNVEIQLRTLLQDVWGELEHKLNYKQGNINQHIKRSFELLSRDIGSMDMLLSHLKNIYDKERKLEEEGKLNEGPSFYFPYDQITPPSFLTEGAFKKEHKAYISFCSKNLSIEPIEKAKHEEAEDKFKNLQYRINKYTNYKSNKSVCVKEKKHIDYWLKMEEAYYDFASKTPERLKKALETYVAVAEDPAYTTEAYVPHFRKGEIHYRTDLIKALNDFDQCELIVDNLMNRNSSSKIHPMNIFLIKSRLAYIYSDCGIEFIDCAIEKIDAAEKIVRDNPDAFNNRRKCDLLNNLCWYYLEKFMATKDVEKKDKKKEAKLRKEAEKCHKKAIAYCEQLIELMDANNVNDYDKTFYHDTTSWLYYQTYLTEKNETKKKSYLKKAASFSLYTNPRPANDNSDRFAEISAAVENQNKTGR